MLIALKYSFSVFMMILIGLFMFSYALIIFPLFFICSLIISIFDASKAIQIMKILLDRIKPN